jgi:hypothetical protein
MFNPLPDVTRADLPGALACAEAQRLRCAAVDEFWRGADAVLHRALQREPARLARSAQRLQARLLRHRLHRQGATAREV